MRPLIFILAVLLASACGGNSPSAPSVSVPFTSTDLIVGTGTAAVNGKTVTVNYTGWLYDAGKPDNKGNQFDSSIGRSPFTFVLGTGQVILGWDVGVGGMKVGGTRRLVVPPNQGYGPNAYGPIPGNSTLVFDIELLNVQ